MPLVERSQPADAPAGQLQSVEIKCHQLLALRFRFDIIGGRQRLARALSLPRPASTPSGAGLLHVWTEIIFQWEAWRLVTWARMLRDRA
jgi:hypothetical protein